MYYSLQCCHVQICVQMCVCVFYINFLKILVAGRITRKSISGGPAGPDASRPGPVRPVQFSAWADGPEIRGWAEIGWVGPHGPARPVCLGVTLVVDSLYSTCSIIGRLVELKV